MQRSTMFSKHALYEDFLLHFEFTKNESLLFIW